MKVVHFKRSWNNYFAGDVAGFQAETADRLVAQGYAEPYADPAAAPEEPEEPETAEELETAAPDGPPADKQVKRRTSRRK